MPRSATGTGVSCSIPHGVLAVMIDRAARAANSKPLPILEFAHVDVIADEARWWATDMRVWLGGVMRGVETERVGAFLLPVSSLKALMRSCPDGLVRLQDLDGERLQVEAGRYRGRVPVLPLEDFPAVPVVPVSGEWVELPRAAMAKAIAQVQTAVTADATKYFLRGALFTGDTWVATDGHRMARAVIVGATTMLPPRIVPVEALTQLGALLDRHASKDVQYLWSGDRHVFVVGDDVLIASSLDAAFPKTSYHFALERTATRVELDRESLIGALARARVTAQRFDDHLQCPFAVGDGQLVVSSQSPERGESVEGVPADVAGGPISTAARMEYIRQFLAIATSERVSLHFKSDMESMLLREVGEGADAFDYIVMPVKL